MSKEKTLADKIIFIDNLINSTFSKKTHLYYCDIIDYLNSKNHDSDYFIEECIQQKDEIERLNNIIKEAKEYIENNVIYTTSGMCLASDTTFGEDILEILDKGE